MSINDLIRKIEQASQGSRELDREIAIALDPKLGTRQRRAPGKILLDHFPRQSAEDARIYDRWGDEYRRTGPAHLSAETCAAIERHLNRKAPR